MAAKKAKKAAKKPAAKKSVAKKPVKKASKPAKKVVKKAGAKRKPNAAFMRPVTPSAMPVMNAISCTLRPSFSQV